MRIDFNTHALRTVSQAAMLAMLLSGGCINVQAQTIYRSVAPDGRVTFSDRPPANTSQTTQLTAGTTEAVVAANLPFALRQIVAKYPVTLYSANDCKPCDEGRILLRARGVPFSEKTVNTPDDTKAFERLFSSNALPFLTIGAQQLKGLVAAEWQQYLSFAGYPATSQLPAGYRDQAPQPLVAQRTTQAPTPAASAAASAQRTPLPPGPTPANPAGIQF